MCRMNVPRPTWNPASYADAVDDAKNGRVFEHHYLEFKTEYGPSKNSDMAGDMAAMANDSGALVVGVDEDKATGVSTGLTPIVLKGFIERVEQVARTLDPPLNVECSQLADPDDPSRGVVFIRMPASPLAPHQANRRYYGRNERTTYRLSDAEVEALMRRRGSRIDRVSAALAATPGFEKVRDANLGRIAVVANPVASHNPELLAEPLAPTGFAVWLDERIAAADAALELVAAHEHLGRYLLQSWSPFRSVGGWSNPRTATGVARLSSQIAEDSLGRMVWLGVDESGSANLAIDGLVGPEPNVIPARTAFDWLTMLTATAWLVLFVEEVAARPG
jgi:hypothetical protein